MVQINPALLPANGPIKSELAEPQMTALGEPPSSSQTEDENVNTYNFPLKGIFLLDSGFVYFSQEIWADNWGRAGCFIISVFSKAYTRP